MVYYVYMLIRTQILLPKEIYDQLKLEAAIRDTSMSKLVSQAVGEKIINKNKKKINARDAIEYMIDHAYRGQKAPRDLSVNDDYLYGPKSPV